MKPENSGWVVRRVYQRHDTIDAYCTWQTDLRQHGHRSNAGAGAMLQFDCQRRRDLLKYESLRRVVAPSRAFAQEHTMTAAAERARMAQWSTHVLVRQADYRTALDHIAALLSLLEGSKK
jgi:hypothetical protein